MPLNSTICQLCLLFSACDFSFYSNEHLPIHIHVRNADGEARFNVEEVNLISNRGLKQKDVKLSEALIEENKELIIQKWNEHFRT